MGWGKEPGSWVSHYKVRQLFSGAVFPGLYLCFRSLAAFWPDFLFVLVPKQRTQYAPANAEAQ